MKQAAVFVFSALVAIPCLAQNLSSDMQKVGGEKGAGVVVPFFYSANDNPYNLTSRMLLLTNAEIVKIDRDSTGKPYLLLDESGQTYRIRSFPDGKYKVGEMIRPLILVKGISELNMDGKPSYLWFSTNAVTRKQLLQHEGSTLALLYPLK